MAPSPASWRLTSQGSRLTSAARGNRAVALLRQERLVDHLVDVHRLFQPLQLLVHESRELLQAADVEARVWRAFPVGVLDVDLDRSPDEPRLGEVALALLFVGEVPLRNGDIVRQECAYGVRMRFQEFFAEEQIQELMVVADCVDGGEELSQAAFGYLGGIEGLDERARAALAAAHRLADRGKGHRYDLGVLVRHQAGVDQARARPEVGRGLDADHADGAALEILGALDRAV